MKMPRGIQAVLLAVLALALLISGPLPSWGATSDHEAAAKAVNAFAIDLYKQIRKPEGNLFFSPYSVSMCLAMAYTGAHEKTASQMANALHFDSDQASLNKSFRSLNAQILAAGQGKAAELNVANALWAAKSFVFQQEFLESIRIHYTQSGGWFSRVPLVPQLMQFIGMSDQAGLRQLDFLNQPDPARKTINGWVEGQTKTKIKDLIPPGAITRDTLLVLANAIYFKGLWEHRFKNEVTKEAPFTLLDGKEVKVPTMRNSHSFGHTQENGLQLLEMTYKGGVLAMVALLPSKEKRLDDFEQSMTLDKLAQWIGNLRTKTVEVYLPRFKLTSAFQLRTALARLGMTDVFSSDNADFSGMTGKKDLFIDEGFHKAFLEVNEERTEAAAATGFIMMATGPQASPRPNI